VSGIAIAGLVLLLVAAAGAGAYFTGYLPWSSAPEVAQRKQATLVPERPPERKETAPTQPAAGPVPEPTPAAQPREEPAAQPPVQARPSQAQKTTSQPTQPQSPGAAAETRTDQPSTTPGLPASEIIKRFVEEAKRNSAKTGAAKGEADTHAPAPAEPPPASAPEDKASAAPPRTGTMAPVPQATAPTSSNGLGTQQPDVQATIESQLPGWTKLQPPSGKASAGAPAEMAKNPAGGESGPEAKALPPAPATAPAVEPEPATLPSQAKPQKPAADAVQAPAPTAEQPNEAAAAPASPPDAAKHKAAEPNAGGSTDETVAMNVPRPSVPPSSAATFEKASLWLRDFAGGDCFYAAPDSTDGTTFGIVGFGTAPDPFVKMMKAFDAQFGTEPDIQVRLISPAQCEVTRFMRGFDPPAGNVQTLTLDRTSVSNGSPISGVLATRGGLRSNLLLIDHDGMTYNIDRLLIVDGDKAKFSARISLDPASRAKGKPMPEIVLAITGAVDILSASTLQAAPASEVLPKIRDEIRRSSAAFSATVKYFQLGG
jgi:serine/threonine-protein kinase